MEVLNTNLVAQNSQQISLQILLNFLVQKYFKLTTCVTQLISDSRQAIELPIPTFVYNYEDFMRYDSKLPNTKLSCQYYIAYDVVPFLRKLEEQEKFRTYLPYKFIIVFDQINIENTTKIMEVRTENIYLSRTENIYLSLFIQMYSDHFDLYEIDNLYNITTRTTLNVINTWNVGTNSFSVQPPILFSDKVMKTKNYSIWVFGYETCRMFALEEFAKRNDMIIDKGCAYSYPMMLWHTIKLVVSSPYKFIPVSTYLFAPKPKIVNYWHSQVYIFEFSFWMAVFVSYIFGAVFFHFVLAQQQRQSILYNLFNMYGIMLGQGIPSAYEPRTKMTKFVMMLLFTLTILVSSLFSSGIVLAMVSPRYEGKIETLQQFFDSKLLVHDIAQIYSQFQAIEEPSDLEMQIYNKSMQWADTWFSESKNISIVSGFVSEVTGCIDTRAYKYSTPLGVDDTYLGYTHDKINIIITRIFKEIQLPEVLLEAFNNFSFRAFDVGLLYQWEVMEYLSDNSIEKMMSELDQSSPPVEPTILSIDHVKGVFALWGICIVFCCFMFPLELMYGCHKKYNLETFS